MKFNASHIHRISESGSVSSYTSKSYFGESDMGEAATEFALSEVKTPQEMMDMTAEKGGYSDGAPMNPYALKHIGLLVNYFSVGIIYGGSVSILYPVMIVKNFESPARYSAAQQLVTLFWAYKIFFGLISDCFPIMGLRRKPYLLLGWVLCAVALIMLAQVDPDHISSNDLVVYLMLANFGYVLSDVCADGYLVWMAKHEPLETRGKTQSLCYLYREVGRAVSNVLIGFALSGPSIMCSNYISNTHRSCPYPSAADANYTFFDNNTVDDENWCHKPCSSATFEFGLTIPQYAWILAACNVIGLPLYIMLYEHKTIRESIFEKLKIFWVIFQRRAVWRITLWTMNNALLSGVMVNAQANTLSSWLNLPPIQMSVLNILENVVFIAGLAVIRKYFINYSWRKLMVIGTVLPIPFGILYLLIVYNVWRNTYFYMFTDLSNQFVTTTAFLVGVFCIVEVSEPGYEAITYSLITSANNMVIPLSTVVSNQIGSLFALQDADILRDDMAVHNQYTICWVVCTIINVASLLTLPLLPNQKVEARELLEHGGSSKLWGGLILGFGFVTLVYSSIASLATLSVSLGCHYWLGGSGCTATESTAPAIILIVLSLSWVVVTTYLIGYKHIIKIPSKAVDNIMHL